MSDKNVICTIITGNYGHYALALYDSLTKHSPELFFVILVTKGTLEDKIISKVHEKSRIKVLYNDDFLNNEKAQLLKKKYSESYHDGYRWGMKPLLLIELLKEFEKAIYLDCDIYFFNDYTFLWNEIANSSLLLSPHWRCSNPRQHEKNFRHNFLDGIYNGGFIGASKEGKEALEYWADLCLFKCEVNRPDGYYVDQRYLDILPTRFERVNHIVHKGCNVSNWNIQDCKRVKQQDDSVLINDKFPIVFIHFTNSFFKGALTDKTDTLMVPYIEKYRDNVLKYYSKDIIEEFFKKGLGIKPRTEQIDEKNGLIERAIKKGIKILKKIKRKLLK